MEANKNQLISFLRAYGVLGEFIDNMLSQHRFRSVEALCTGRDYKLLIIEAFNWTQTSQGEKTWKRIHAVWANSSPTMFSLKPDSFMTAYPVGKPVQHPVHGVIVPERCDGKCFGCVFLKAKRECTNDGQYGCTPLARGDGEQVIYKKM